MYDSVKCVFWCYSITFLTELLVVVFVGMMFCQFCSCVCLCLCGTRSHIDLLPVSRNSDKIYF
jgi:hypothetical protein